MNSKNIVTHECFFGVQRVLMFSGGCIYLRYRTQEVEIQYVNLSDTFIIFAYCHASMNLDDVDVLYVENGNAYKPVLKNKTTTMFFLKKPF